MKTNGQSYISICFIYLSQGTAIFVRAVGHYQIKDWFLVSICGRQNCDGLWGNLHNFCGCPNSWYLAKFWFYRKRTLAPKKPKVTIQKTQWFTHVHFPAKITTKLSGVKSLVIGSNLISYIVAISCWKSFWIGSWFFAKCVIKRYLSDNVHYKSRFITRDSFLLWVNKEVNMGVL